MSGWYDVCRVPTPDGTLIHDEIAAITAAIAGSRMIAILGANLRDAGAACASFTLGMKASKDLYWHGRTWWSPGCGKDAAAYLEEL